MKKIQELRKKYPIFVYENYSYRVSNNNLEILFTFKIPPKIKFQPKIIIENINKSQLKKIGLPSVASAKEGDGVLNNLIFHLGLIEIPSYWKTTCSPEIIIEAGHMNIDQMKWWKNLLISGMGQFYYENKIDWTHPNFLKIVNGQALKDLKIFNGKLKNRYLVPFAGGRDSIVTLESLKKISKNISLFTVNPIEKIQKVVKISGINNQIIVRRQIDKKLIDLNKNGFLNGHTPFTSLLSFTSVLCAVLFDYKNIAFSNEKSSNEGNVKYLGKIINHQWAKSSEFEKSFKLYCKKYLAKDINYFSYIRKYTELEISKKLSQYKKYLPVFSSCNAGMKMGAKGRLAAKKRWCGNCPKCLFVYLTLYPFLKKEELLKIFGRDIFGNKALLPVMRDLLGLPAQAGKSTGHKPLECVGTKAETQKAFKLSLAKARREGIIPYLLK